MESGLMDSMASSPIELQAYIHTHTYMYIQRCTQRHTHGRRHVQTYRHRQLSDAILAVGFDHTSVATLILITANTEENRSSCKYHLATVVFKVRVHG